MANEFKIKTGLILGPPATSQPVISIQNSSTSITANASTFLVSANAIHEYVSPIFDKDFSQDSSIFSINASIFAIESSLGDYVNKSGDIMSGNLQINASLFANDIHTDILHLNTSPTVGSFEPGKIFYDVPSKTISAMIDNDVTMQIGQEELVLVYNGTGVVIPNGKMVYANGANGDMPTIALAKADSLLTALPIGMTTQSIPNGQSGLVTNRGIVHFVDTSSYTPGNYLYLSPYIAGAVTEIAPTDTDHYLVICGRTLINASIGSVYVRQILNNRLTDLTDVAINSPVTDQVLRFNGTEWVNGAQLAVSAGSGVTFFLDESYVLPPGTGPQTLPLHVLSKTPITTTEIIDSVSVNNTTKLIDMYMYNTSLGGTQIDAGKWEFNNYCYVSSDTSISTIPVTVRNVEAGSGAVSIIGSGTSRTAISTDAPFAIEKITNIADREFTSDTGFWQLSFSSISDGSLNISGLGDVSKNNLLTIGKTYIITYTILKIDAIFLQFACLVGNTFGEIVTSAGTYTDTIVCNGNTNFWFRIIFGVPSNSVIIDNVSIKELNTDFGNADMTLAGLLQTPKAIFKISNVIDSSSATVETLSTYTNESSVGYNLHKFLFNAIPAPIVNTTVGLTTTLTVQPAFPIQSPNKLSVGYYARSTGDVSIYLYHNGTDHYTNFVTPLAIRHNDLSGIQGGSGSGIYHLDLIKYNIVQNTLGVNTGDQNLSGLVPYTGATTDVDLGIRNLTIDTSTLFVNSSTHQVGIGTTTPITKLTVNGSIGILGNGGIDMYNTAGSLTGRLTNNADRFNFYGYWSTAFSDYLGEIMRLQAGKVGIGTISPSEALHVVGNGQFNETYPYINLKPTAWSLPFYFQSGTSELATASSSDYTVFLNPAGKGFSFNQQGAPRILISPSTGYVGIGTSSPQEKLDVSGNIQSSLKINAGKFGLYAGLGVYSSDVDLPIIAGNNASSISNIIFKTNNGGSVTEKMRIDSSGNILISPLSYSSELVVGPSMQFSGTGLRIGTARRLNYIEPLISLRLSGVDGADTFKTPYAMTGGESGYSGLHLKYNGDVAFYAAKGDVSVNQIVTPPTRLFIDGSFGYVGIGTGTPTATLHIVSDTGGGNSGIKLTMNAPSNYGSIDFQTSSGVIGQFVTTGHTFTNQSFKPDSVYLTNSYIDGHIGFASFGANGYIKFLTGGLADANERLRITNTGNVGVGTLNPSTKFHVFGVISASGGDSSMWNTAYNLSILNPSDNIFQWDVSKRLYAPYPAKKTTDPGIAYFYSAGLDPSFHGTLKLDGILSATQFSSYTESTNAFYGKTISGFGLYGEATVAGTGVYGKSISGTGVEGFSSSSFGVKGQSSSYYGIYGISGTGVGVLATSTSAEGLSVGTNPATTDVAHKAAIFQRATSNLPANGIGQYISFECEVSASYIPEVAKFGQVMIDVSRFGFVSGFEWSLANSAVITRKMALSGTGKLTLDGYGSGNQTGVSTRSLNVDGSGNIIEVGVQVVGQTYNIKIIDDVTVLQIGDSQLIFCIPDNVNNFKLTTCAAYVTTCSSSGLPTIKFRNITKATSFLTTPLTIDASEYTSFTAATPVVINASTNTINTGDLIAIDVSTAGSGAKGLGVILTFS